MNGEEFMKDMQELANDRTRSGIPDVRNHAMWKKYLEWCRRHKAQPSTRDYVIWKQQFNDGTEED